MLSGVDRVDLSDDELADQAGKISPVGRTWRENNGLGRLGRDEAVFVYDDFRLS